MNPPKPTTQPNRVELAGKQGAILSVIEVGLGSILHGLRIPFSGHALSLNQGFILTRAVRKGQRASLGAEISAIAALLKSLSPAGKKLTPMLAIAAQGQIFTFCTAIFGIGLPGALIGMWALSLWAFLQPVLTYLLLYGKTIIHVGEYFIGQLQRVLPFEAENLLWILAGVILVKLVLATAVTLLAFRLSESAVEEYQNRMLKAGKHRAKRWLTDVGELSFGERLRLAIKDLCHPLFLLSLFMTGIFFWFANSSLSETIWGLMRPLAIAFLVFFSVRMISFDRLVRKLQEEPTSPKWQKTQKLLGLQRLGRSMEGALQTLRGL